MVHYPDKSLCLFFHAGLNTQTRSHLPGDGPQGALCEVLQNNKSPFTVGEVEENLTLFVSAPDLDFLPEPSQPLIYHTSHGPRANAHAHREPQAGALACNRPPIQGAVCPTTLFNLEPAPAAQSVLEPTFIDLSVLEVIPTLKPSPKTHPPSLLPSSARALPLDILPESFSALQLYCCSHGLMATQVHPTCDVQPSGSPWPSEAMILLRALASQWFVIPLNPPDFSSLSLQLGLLPSLASLRVHLSGSTLVLQACDVALVHHSLAPLFLVFTSSGTSSVFQSPGSTMVSCPAISSMDLHPYGSTIRSSPPPAPPWSLHLLPPPMGVSSPAVVFSSVVVISFIGSARVCFALPFILCS